MNRKIVLIAHNVRSCHNVGSLLRTAEGLGVAHVYLTGYTPYPAAEHDARLPHLSQKISRQIHKTALGAEELINWQHAADISEVLRKLRRDGFVICALEQAPDAVNLLSYQAPQRVALVVGREVEGIEPDILRQMDHILHIPMRGKKESFNVVQAAAMGLFYLHNL